MITVPDRGTVPVTGETAEVGPASPGITARPAPDHGGHDGRLFGILLAGYPAAWALGLSPVWYAVLALPMMLWLIRNRPVRVAPGTGYLALFLIVVALSGIGLESAGSVAVFGLRSSWYAAAFVAYLYLARRQGARSTITLLSSPRLWLMTMLPATVTISVAAVSRTSVGAVGS